MTGGYGKYTNKAYGESETDYGTYETTIIPLTLRLRVSPWDLKGWNPYFYIGGGLMDFSVDKKPTGIVSPKTTEDNGWVAIIPAGIGAEFAIAERVLLDFSIGYNMSSTYDLDSYNTGKASLWDSYLNVGLGLTFTGENCNVDKDNDGLGKCSNTVWPFKLS